MISITSERNREPYHLIHRSHVGCEKIV